MIKNYLLKEYKSGKDHNNYSREKIKESILKLPSDLFLSLITYIYPNRIDYFNRVTEKDLKEFQSLTHQQKYKLRLKAYKVLQEVLND